MQYFEVSKGVYASQRNSTFYVKMTSSKLGKSVPPNWNLFHLAYFHHFQAILACFLLDKRGPIACEK